MKLLSLLLLVFPASLLGQALPYIPPAHAAYVSTTGLPGSWQPMTGSGGTAVPYVPSAVGLYCSNDGSGNVGTWVPCSASGGGGSVSITSSTGDLTVSPSPLTGTGTIDLNLSHANQWFATQEFSANTGIEIFPTGGAGILDMSGTSGDLWQLTANAGASNNHKFGFYNSTSTIDPLALSASSTSGTTWVGFTTVGGVGWTTQAQFPDHDTTLATGFWLVNNTGNIVSLGNGTPGNGSGALQLAQVRAGVLYSAAGTALPTCASTISGVRAVVSDATSPTYMGAYTSGGHVVVEVICSTTDGTTFAWATH